MKLRGGRVLITGAASGVGLGCAQHFSELGARVWGLDNDAGALEKARNLAPGLAERLLHCDVGRPDEVESSVDRVLSEDGGLDVVLNNAAILRDQTLVSRLGKRVKKHSVEDWLATLDSNLTGTFLVAREVAANWLANRAHGVIVNTSSVVRSGNPGQSAYAACKSAIDSLTVTWSQELAPYGIRVAGIAYGFAETGLTRNIPPMFLEQIRRKSAVGRFGSVAELVNGVQFIVENDYFAGRVLEIDGGLRF